MGDRSQVREEKTKMIRKRIRIGRLRSLRHMVLLLILCFSHQCCVRGFQNVFGRTSIQQRQTTFLNRNTTSRSIKSDITSMSKNISDSGLFVSQSSRKRKGTHRISRAITIIFSVVLASTFPASQVWAGMNFGESLVLVRNTFPWKRMVKSAISFAILSSGISQLRMKRRQSKIATSEWARYARKPSARGRAIMWMLTQQGTFLLLSKILWFRKSAIRVHAGKHFADSLLKLGPLYIKLGQIVSCRKNLLGSEWIEAMATLQDKVPARTGEEAMELAYSTLQGGKEEFDALFSEFDSTPLAAASLGQVHKGRLRKTGDVVAIKLQRPFLKQIYDEDLKLLTKIARMMDNLPGSKKDVGGVASSWTKIFDDAEKILYREIDYRDEARNSIRFSQEFGLSLGGKSAPFCTAKANDGEALPSASDWIRTPYVFEDISNERLLVMEFVPSIKITDNAKLDAANVTMEDRIELADALARAYLRQLCCNLFFSTDPHPGNLGVEIFDNRKPRLVIYDFGQAATLTQDQADGILDMIEAIIDTDVERSIEAFIKMGVLVDGADLDKVRSKVADNYRTGKIKADRKKLQRKGYKLKEEIDSMNSTATTTEPPKDSEVMSFFTLPAEYAFVARALSQMDGVGKGLDPDFDFISNGAPFIYEIKGARKYLKDQVKKFVDNIFRPKRANPQTFEDIKARITDLQIPDVVQGFKDEITR